MNQEQLKQLESALDDGNFQVYYMPNAGLLKQVVSIFAHASKTERFALLANGCVIALA